MRFLRTASAVRFLFLGGVKMNRKCEMCGGQIVVQPGAAYGICDSCGAKVDLGFSYQEREQMRKQEIYQRQQLSKLEEEKESVKEQITSLGKMNIKKKSQITQFILSVLPYIVIPFFAILLNDSELLDGIVSVIMMIAVIGIIVATVFLVKYSNVLAGKKGRTAKIILLQYFTAGMFGIVAGVIDIIKIVEEKKNASTVQSKLQKQLESIMRQEEIIKNNIEI